MDDLLIWYELLFSYDEIKIEVHTHKRSSPPEEKWYYGGDSQWWYDSYSYVNCMTALHTRIKEQRQYLDTTEKMYLIGF